MRPDGWREDLALMERIEAIGSGRMIRMRSQGEREAAERLAARGLGAMSDDALGQAHFTHAVEGDLGRRYQVNTISVLDVAGAAAVACKLAARFAKLPTPDITGLDLPEARAALVQHQVKVDAVKVDQAHAAAAVLPPHWRARGAKAPGTKDYPWPPFADIPAWAGLGASHALSCYPTTVTDEHKGPNYRAYTAAYKAVFGAYMQEPATNPALDALTEVGDPGVLTWSSRIDKIAGAYAKAQATMGALVKGHTAEIKPRDKAAYSYDYANLPDALDACLAAFNAQGCAVIQPVTTGRGGINVSTMIVHEGSGQWIRAAPLLMLVNGNAQAQGSAATFGRRYQLLGMVGLAPNDDDGKSADDNPPPKFVACKPETAQAIGILCHQIASLANVRHEAVLKHAWKSCGYPYNADVTAPGDLDPNEAIAIHKWLESDLENYGKSE